MKKILLIMMLLLSFVSVAFAKTPPGWFNIKNPSQIGLGGIQLLNTFDQIEKIYGKPTASYRSKQPIKNPLFIKPYHKWEIYYGKTIKLEFIQLVDSNKLELLEMESTGNNGWKTPDGLTVGMKEEMIEKILGTAYRSKDRMDEYVYNWENWGMNFTVKDGVITKITCICYEG